MAPTQTQDRPNLTALDRCDRCGAQAYVEVNLNAGGTLLFCAHHVREHEEALNALDATIHDERPRLEAEEAGASAH